MLASTHRFRDRLGSVLTITAALASAGVLVLDATTGDASTAAPITPGTLSVKTATSVVSALPEVPITPGSSGTASVRVLNDGDVPARITLAAATTDPDGKHLGRALLFAATRVSAPAACTRDTNDTPDISATNAGPKPTPFAGPAIRLDPGETAWMCTSISAPLDLPNSYQDASTAVTLSIRSTQEIR